MRTKFMLLCAALGACHAEPTTAPANDEASTNLPEAASPAPEPNAATPEPAKPGRQSQFTALDEKSCSLVEQNKDEGGWWKRRCPGAAGYSVEWTESDLRQGLNLVAPGGKRTELPISTTVAKGAFNHLGPRLEWRGADPARPETLTMRVMVARNVEPQQADKSLLVVARLQPTPCLVAVVDPGATQSDQARRIADGPLPACLRS